MARKPQFRHDPKRKVCVLLLVASLLAFVVYLKVLPHLDAGTGTRTFQVKIWMEPNQASKTTIAVAPLVFPVFLLLSILPVLQECVGLWGLSISEAVPRGILVDSRNWVRPPPLF